MEAEEGKSKNENPKEPRDRGSAVSTSSVLRFFGSLVFPPLVLWFFGSLIFLAGCRSHAWLRRSGGDPPPIAFSALPSPTEAVSAVNANTARIQSLQTQGA